MSDIPADYRDRLDLREQIARIDRTQAELQKLVAEQGKLNAEQTKLNAEGRKFNRDPWILMVAAIIGGIAAVVARLPEILAALGLSHVAH